VNGKLWCGLGLALWLCGCATTPEVLTLRDNATGETAELITDNLLPSPQPGDANVWLNATRLAQLSGDAQYYLEVHYESPAVWLNIDFGRTLTVIADGQEMVFSGLGSDGMRDVGKNEQVMETAIYHCTTTDLRRIAYAKSVKIQVKGAALTIEREFGPDNIAQFRQFVAKSVDRAKI